MEVDKFYNKLGGKAEGLNTLRRIGYEVPNFFVVGYDENISDIDLSILEVAESHSRHPYQWAVRSSANVEDGKKMSFAGQFDSIIGVQTEDIKSAILDVRDSASSDRVKEYCRILGISSDEIEMNVIVQEFEEPLCAGVWMGNDNQGGRLEWVEGRGDKLVSGQLTPQFEIYDKDQNLLDGDPNDILLNENGQAVSSICKEIEAKIGSATDLEFCITNKGLSWLQLRTVTADMPQSIRKQTEQVNLTTMIGEPASPYIAEGAAHRHDIYKDADWTPGKILVVEATTQDEMLLMMNAEGVVAKRGGKLSHAAIVCRELGKACVVGIEIKDIDHAAQLHVNGINGSVAIKKK